MRPEALALRVLAGDRRALARAITLIESGRPDHVEQAERLLERLLPATGKALRLGISGAPGVGKSTFIEALGRHLVAEGRRVAVLAVDPSSRRGGGSVLADKTRMPELAQAEAAFIRPSPAGDGLGGVARRTREAALACEAAGYGVVIVETVGVGQSETAVADMADTFLLLLAPGGGDELQGVKRGIVELADLVVVNKADGELRAAAGRVAADYRAALRLLRPKTGGWTAQVLTCSAQEGEGIAAVWDAVLAHRGVLEAGSELTALRRRQARSWLRGEVEAGLLAALRGDPESAALLREAEARIERTLPARAARRIVARFLGRG